MLKNKQLLKHNPESGEFGDCYRTCIACLLNLQPQKVPHFAEMFEHHGLETLFDRMWLRETMKMDMINVPYNCSLEQLYGMQKHLNNGVYYILGGTSKNNTGHSVICVDDRIEWDPAQDDSGIIGPMSDGMYWVTYLVPLSCTSPDAKMGTGVLQ